jgi:hypothetical protein
MDHERAVEEPALLTGRMPLRSGTFRVPLPVAPWEYTAAELFSDAGYGTACFGKWHLGNVAGRLPIDQDQADISTVMSALGRCLVDQRGLFGVLSISCCFVTFR